MDFLNQAISQVRELFLSMTPAARITALLLVGVIGVSLTFLFQQHSSGPDGYLFNGKYLAPNDADRAEAAIAQAGLNGYERVGNRIRVPQSHKAEYLAAVADGGALPTNFDTLLEDALNMGPFVDRETRRQRLKAARERQLSMMVCMMDGVTDAKVIYDSSQQRGLSRKQHVTATVSVRPDPGEPLNARRLKMIKKAVAGAIAGLSPSDVNVANQVDGSMYGGGDSEITAESFEDPYFQSRVTYERWIKGNIEELLRDIPGIRVQVSAELDDTLSRTVKSVKADGDGTAMRETLQEDETINQKVEDGGRPGLVANGPLRSGDQSELAKTENTTSSKTQQSENFISTTEELLTHSGLIPQKVRVAVAVPSSYLLRVWEERHKDASEDEKPTDTMLASIENSVTDQIKNLITPLLPVQSAGKLDSYAAVVVKIFESLTPDPIEEPTTANIAMLWLNQNMSSMMMGGLALVSLVMLRSMVKSVPPPEPVPVLSVPTLSVEGGPVEPTNSPEETNVESEKKSRPRLKLKKGTSLKDDLTEIVQEDPEAAAAILRTWINNAS